MMRINLLPPEILERRRAEKRVGYVVVAAMGIAVVLAGVWVFGYANVQGREQELASLQQQVQSTNAAAAQLSIFEERAAELQARKATAALALGNRRDWARLLDEMSLVLPADMWVQTVTADQNDGIGINGYAVDSPKDNPDAGHKSIAKALVRLADLDDLFDVWLTSSQKSEFEEQDVIQFSITAKVVVPTVDVPSSTTVSAPAGEAGTP